MYSKKKKRKKKKNAAKSDYSVVASLSLQHLTTTCKHSVQGKHMTSTVFQTKQTQVI